MSTKTKTAARAPTTRAATRPVTRPVASTPPWTTEERLHRIEAMAERIKGYVEFMCQVGNLKGTSTEAMERAVITFYEQMVVLERQLGQIHDDFKLE